MADVKPATLAPCEDSDVLEAVADLTENLHRSLAGAKFLILWALDRPLKWWGRIKIASEATWWATGAAEGGVNIELQINDQLWRKLSRDGRKGLLDLYMEAVRRKDSGTTEMRTLVGMRPLFKRNENTLGLLSDRVFARNPALVQDIDELRRLHKALADPVQFALEFEASDEDEDPDGGGEAVSVAKPAKRGRKPKAAGPLASAPVVHYFERKNLDDFGPCVLRFTEADHRPESLDGVYYLTDGEKDPADVTGLAYKADGVAVRPVRAALEEEHAGWASAALAKGKEQQATA